MYHIRTFVPEARKKLVFGEKTNFRGPVRVRPTGGNPGGFEAVPDEAGPNFSGQEDGCCRITRTVPGEVRARRGRPRRPYSEVASVEETEPGPGDSSGRTSSSL